MICVKIIIAALGYTSNKQRKFMTMISDIEAEISQLGTYNIAQ